MFWRRRKPLLFVAASVKDGKLILQTDGDYTVTVGIVGHAVQSYSIERHREVQRGAPGIGPLTGEWQTSVALHLVK